MGYGTDAANIEHWISASRVKFVLLQSVVHGTWLGMGYGTDAAIIEHCNSASSVKSVLVFQSVVHGTWLGMDYGTDAANVEHWNSTSPPVYFYDPVINSYT
jgi:hypothetical protein